MLINDDDITVPRNRLTNNPASHHAVKRCFGVFARYAYVWVGDEKLTRVPRERESSCYMRSQQNNECVNKPLEHEAGADKMWFKIIAILCTSTPALLTVPGRDRVIETAHKV